MKDKILPLIRIGLGWMFLWSFLDKLLVLGFSADKAWIDGASPTYGFLTYGTEGVFADIFHTLAGNMFVDWMFMLGMLYIGISLITGITLKLGSVIGIVMLLLITLAVIPFENNPIIDEHIIYILVLLSMHFYDEYKRFSFAYIWNSLTLINKIRFLQS